jgi:hypothetical protein
MNDTSLQGLLERAATGHEPPVAAIVSNALLAGRRLQRRRRIRGAACGLAAAGAIAAGVPALAGSLGGPPGRAAPSPAQAGASSPAASPPAHSAPVPGWFAFATPAAVPAQHPSGDLLPVTAKSAELLLLDLLPASTTHAVSSQAANAHDGTEVTAQVDARSAAGTGTAIVSMSRTRVSHLQSCAAQGTGPDGDLACRTYHLPGGVSVQEALLGDGPSPKGGADRYVVAVTVLRADGFAVSFQASSYRFDTLHEKGLTTRPPMTVSQLVKAAADPRWSLRMPRAFVARAATVRLSGPTPKG